MKQIIQIEELAITAATIYLFTLIDVSFSWWVYILLFFSPDISMIGYILGNRLGAVLYNIFHHRGLAIAIIIMGIYLHNDYTTLAGLIILAHASFDRMLGYGLKHFTGFKHTHLGNMK